MTCRPRSRSVYHVCWSSPRLPPVFQRLPADRPGLRASRARSVNDRRVRGWGSPGPSLPRWRRHTATATRHKAVSLALRCGRRLRVSG